VEYTCFSPDALLFLGKRSFLAKRGVKEEIQTFDARKITPETRKTVEGLLKKNRDSFDPKVTVACILFHSVFILSGVCLLLCNKTLCCHRRYTSSVYYLFSIVIFILVNERTTYFVLFNFSNFIMLTVCFSVRLWILLDF